MTDMIRVLFAAAIGGALAIFYFGGLWWTVRRLATAPRPAAFYFGSLLVRLAIVLIAFFVVISFSQWPPLVACIVGFLSVRLAMIRCLAGEKNPSRAEQAG